MDGLLASEDLQSLRNDKDKASQLLRSVFREPADYNLALRQLATSIGYAEEASENGWTLSLKPGTTVGGKKLFRLSMGQVEVLTADFKAKIRVLMTEPSMAIQNDLKANLTTIYYPVADPSNELWVFEGTVHELNKNRQSLLPFHKSLIDLPSLRRKKPAWDSHSPGLVALAHLYSHETDASLTPNDLPFGEEDSDERKRVLRLICDRQGQGPFRESLLLAYGGRCAITGCDAEPALEAAHIVPYKGPITNDVRNGLLLRADLHSLFDLGLIAVRSTDMTLLVSRELSHTEYQKLAGAPLRLPKDIASHPSTRSLDRHLEEFKQKLDHGFFKPQTLPRTGC